MYKALDQYMKDNPGQVDNFVAHSKAASVVEKWMANNPDWKGHARLYGTPHVDPVGSEIQRFPPPVKKREKRFLQGL